jgi:hypothetical protein
MTQPEPGAQAHTGSLAHALRPVLADTLLALRGLELHIEVVSHPPDPTGWLEAVALAEPDGLPLSALLQRFKSAGFAFNRRAASASLMLRCGWASGFAIAAYLTRARVPFVGDYALYFSISALLKGLWIREAQFVGRADDPVAGGPEWMERSARMRFASASRRASSPSPSPLSLRITSGHASRVMRSGPWQHPRGQHNLPASLGNSAMKNEACTRRGPSWLWFLRSSARHRNSTRYRTPATRAPARSSVPAAFISKAARASSVRAVRSFPMPNGLSAIAHGLRRKHHKLRLELAGRKAS